MLTTLRRLLTRHRSCATDMTTPARIEGLERRSLLSGTMTDAPPVSAAEEPDVTGPMVVKEQLIGSDPRNVTGVVVTFNEPLDEASAENLRHFRVGTRTDRRQRAFDDNRFRGNRRGLVRFESAVYDPANFTVTLTAFEPFNITRRFRTIRVLGRETLAVRDVAGNALDGDGNGTPGGDSVQQYTFRRAARVSYGELDGDNVSLSLKGGGLLWVIRKTSDGKVLARGDALRVFIDRADPASSILTGRVSGKGNGVAVIEELVNTSTAQLQIAADPAFEIVRSIP
jgi:hypothetical protein